MSRCRSRSSASASVFAKPFEPRELLARIKNVLRRSEGRPAEPDPDEVAAFEFGDLTLGRSRAPSSAVARRP